MPHRLIIEPDFSDYLIYGLSTHLKDYKLCWHLNNAIKINMIRHPDLIIDENNNSRKFSLFVCDSTFDQLSFYLISNYDRHIPWFAKAKHFHYFFIINGSPLNSHVNKIVKCLNEIPQMLLVTLLSADEKKLAMPLLTNFELHITETTRNKKEQLKNKIPKRAGIKK